MWTCHVWAKRSTPHNFWVPSHRFNFATGEQKEITQTIYTDSEPPVVINAKRQAEKRKPPSFYVFGMTRSESNPGLPHPERGRSNYCATRGRIQLPGAWVHKMRNGRWESVCILAQRTAPGQMNVNARIGWYSANNSQSYCGENLKVLKPQGEL